MTGTVTIDGGGLSEVILRLQATQADMRRSIAAAVYNQALRLERIIKDDKLQGGVLRKRTGRLRNSVHTEMLPGTGDVAVVGTDVEYAAYHEYGFVGTEQVREHLRRITQVFGRPLQTPLEVLVQAHARQIDYPAHSFLRSTLAEEEPAIRAAVLRAAQQPGAPS